MDPIVQRRCDSSLIQDVLVLHVYIIVPGARVRRVIPALCSSTARASFVVASK